MRPAFGEVLRALMASLDAAGATVYRVVGASRLNLVASVGDRVGRIEQITSWGDRQIGATGMILIPPHDDVPPTTRRCLGRLGVVAVAATGYDGGIVGAHHGVTGKGWPSDVVPVLRLASLAATIITSPHDIDGLSEHVARLVETGDRNGLVQLRGELHSLDLRVEEKLRELAARNPSDAWLSPAAAALRTGLQRRWLVEHAAEIGGVVWPTVRQPRFLKSALDEWMRSRGR